MATSPDFAEFLMELFAPLGGVSMRRMFGGHGVYRDGVIFGLVIDDVLHLKVDDGNRAAFEAEGATPFSYPGKSGKIIALPYWRLPDRLYDEPDDFLDWARSAITVAQRAEAAKAAKPLRSKAR